MRWTSQQPGFLRHVTGRRRHAGTASYADHARARHPAFANEIVVQQSCWSSAVDPACKKSSLDVIPRKPGRAFRHAAHLASSKRYTASRALMEASMAVNGTDPVGRWWHRSAWRRLLCDHPTGPLEAGREA
jgi:hypothetical protein